MGAELKDPQEYMDKLDALRKENPHVKRLPLRLESRTNKHPDCSGRSWGWYEIYPLGIQVGFWGADKDDLDGVDIQAWNNTAAQISMAA